MKKISIYLAGAALAGAAVFTLVRAPFGAPVAEAVTGTVVSSFQLPLETGRSGRNPQGLAYDGQYFWLMDADFKGGGKPRFYKTTTAGSIVSSFLVPELGDYYDCNYKGLAWDGEYLRLAASDSYDGRIYLIDTSFPGGEVPPHISVENQLPFGVGWETSPVAIPYLWEVDNKDGIIYRVDPTTGNTEDQITTNVGILRRPGGLAYETGADRVWISGYGKGDKIYGFATDGTPVGSFDAPSTHPMGLTWDGAYLWYVDGCTDYFYKIELTE